MSNKDKDKYYYYRVFCMANMIGVKQGEDLDVMWELADKLYSMFLGSKFDLFEMHELECMELFYNDYIKCLGGHTTT